MRKAIKMLRLYTQTHTCNLKNKKKRKIKIYKKAFNFDVNKINNNVGITLIAFVITIVILIILAGVAINLTIGENGILKKAISAREETKKSQILEELNIKIIAIQTEKQGNATFQDVINELQFDLENEYTLSTELATINGTIPDLSNISILYIKYKNYWFKLNSSLQISFADNNIQEPQNPTNPDSSQISTTIGNTNIGRAFEYGEDIPLYKFYSTSTDVNITYNGNKISSTKDLPVGEYVLSFDQQTNNIIVRDENHPIDSIDDLSGKNHTLNLKNGISIAQDSNENYYLNFDGIDDYAQITELEESIDWANGFTVEFEAEWNAFNTWSRIIDFGNGSSSNNIVVANYIKTNNLISLILNGNSQETHDFKAEGLVLNEKAKFKINYDKTDTGYNISFFKNNSNFFSTSTTYKINNLSRKSNFIGKSNWDNQYFKGKIYSLKITQADGTVVLWYDINEWLNMSK